MQISANFNLNLDQLMKLFYTSTFFSICNYLHFARLGFICHTIIEDRVKRYHSSQKYKEKNSNNSSEPNKKGICLIASKTVWKLSSLFNNFGVSWN